MDRATMIYKFDGSEPSQWNRFVIKTIATGEDNDGWNVALEQDLPIEGVDLGVETRNKELRKRAWVHLMLALEDEALDLAASVKDKNPYMAWNLLIKKYSLKGTNALVKVLDEFDCYMLSADTANPEPWMKQLIKLNKKIGEISPGKMHDDHTLIATINCCLP